MLPDDGRVRVPGHRRPARGGAHVEHQGRCSSSRRRTRPARCTRRTRSRRSAAGRSSTASGSSPTRSTSTSRSTTTCFTSMPALVPELAERCVVLNGVAKTYAMTGWRVGWMIGPRRRHQRRHQPAVALDVERRRTSRSAPRSPRSRGDLEAVAMMRDAFARRGKTMHALLSGIPGRRVPRARGRVLLLPELRGCPRPRARRPQGVEHARARRRAARAGEGRDRPGRGVRRARLRPPVVRPRRRRPR